MAITCVVVIIAYVVAAHAGAVHVASLLGSTSIIILACSRRGACRAVPLLSPALPSAPALVLVLVLVLADSAIGDANGALDQG